MKNIEVSSAIIIKDNKIFIAQRGYGDFKDKWEFPGGKLEKDESGEDCIVREIKEELDTEIVVGDLLTTIEYDYPKFHLSMQCFWCRIVDGTPVLKEHEAARWLDVESLDGVAWLPADQTIIPLIQNKIIDQVASDILQKHKAAFQALAK